MTSTSRKARIAGLLYLLLAIVGPLRLMYIPKTLFVQGKRAGSDQVGQSDFSVKVNMPINKVRREIPRGFLLRVKIGVKATDTAGHKSSVKRTFSICGAG